MNSDDCLKVQDLLSKMVIVTIFLIGYRKRMPFTLRSPYLALWAGILLCVTQACSNLTTPRFTEPKPQEPVIPASVTLIFDDSVKSATFQENVCADTLWTGQLGDEIVKAFQDMGRARFASVAVVGMDAKPQPAASASTSSITALIKMIDSSFKSRTRTGSGDNYTSQLDIKLQASFQDGSGKPLADAPLVYSDRFTLYTPQYGGSGQCATQGLDGAMKTATEYLATQFAGYVAELTAKAQGYTIAGDQRSGGTPASQPRELSVRATLLDENNNLILEGGEKVGIRLDVTNTGTSPVGPSSVTLSGTPVLLDAFSGSMSTHTQIAGLQPGETTSAIIWGKVPATIDQPRGELTVSVTPSGEANGAAATQTLVATMASGGATAAVAGSQPAKRIPSSTAGGQDQNRYALVVGLSLYRSPWPGWRDGLVFDGKETTSLLTNTLNVPEGHILLLQDELAGQSDIEEALASWLPKRVTKDSIVFFYFAGQTVVDLRNGEIFLIPYDGTPVSSQFRLISLRFLQSRLQKMGAKAAIAIIDSPLTARPTSKDGKAKLVPPNWVADLDGAGGPIDSPLLQVSRMGKALRPQYGLLAGLTGSADLDHDGIVTLGEWLRSLRGTAITAPSLPPTLAVQSIPLSHVNHR